MSEITKKALEEALKKLLKEKPLGKISIQELTAECGMNRMTFYYHFKDIYDLVEWSLLQDAKTALKGQKTADTWEEGLLNIFLEVRENQSFIRNVYLSVSREYVEGYLYHLTRELLLGVVEELSRGISVPEKDKVFIADFYKYAFVGTMLEWIRNDMKEDPERLVNKMASVMHGNFLHALKALSSEGEL